MKNRCFLLTFLLYVEVVIPLGRNYEKIGTFLIRNNGNNENSIYSLSIRYEDSVKHYRIQQQLIDNKEVFFISNLKMFGSLAELVNYYSESSDELNVTLSNPCVVNFEREKPSTIGLSRSTVQDLEIDRSSFKLERMLGEGQFGQVWKGIWNNTTPVVIKMLKSDSIDSEQFLTETQLMRKLIHPRLVQLYAVCSLEEPMYLILELMKFGSLIDYLRVNSSILQTKDLVDIAGQIATGMAFLESQNYIHGDLSSRNILVGDYNRIKIGDFGLMKLVREYKVLDNKLRTTAPEAISSNRFSIKSDVWSFGILLTELMTFGRIPYHDMDNQQVIRQIERGYRMPCPEGCPQDLYEIMCECWHSDPSSRPTFDALKWRLEYLFTFDNRKFSIVRIDSSA